MSNHLQRRTIPKAELVARGLLFGRGLKLVHRQLFFCLQMFVIVSIKELLDYNDDDLSQYVLL